MQAGLTFMLGPMKTLDDIPSNPLYSFLYHIAPMCKGTKPTWTQAPATNTSATKNRMYL